MKRGIRIISICASGGMLLQFGGCLADALADVFFVVGPFLL